MDILKKILGNSVTEKSAQTTPSTQQPATVVVEREVVMPRMCTESYMSLFRTLPEVFFPIHYIASRIAGAHFEVKRTKDDSIVWCGRRVCDMLIKPNCLMGWREMVYSHFTYKLASGNAFMRAAMAESASKLPKHKYCSNFWPLPADRVQVVPASVRIPIYDIADEADIVGGYELKGDWNQGVLRIPAWQVWHDRDGKIDDIRNGANFLKSASRLDSVLKPISNLLAVYEARNVIYVKRGGIGFLVSLKHDETGTVAMNPKEKDELRKQLDSEYGVTSGKSPIGITDVPLNFVRTNLSIAELQPFEETLYDAIEIAGAYGIPAVLVPRKDQSTFANQSTAEKAVYTGVIIPMAKQFCEDLTRWLGLNDSNIYIDCNFDDVDCLQLGRKEAEQVKALVNDRCLRQFMAGMITLNDWRAQIHESQLDEEEMPLFSKLRWQMTDEELERVNTIMLNTIQTSTGDENGQRNEEEPRLRDEGE